MTSRDKLIATLGHRQPEGVCVDLGGTHTSGIAASALHRLRQAVLGEKDYLVRVHEPYQMLGEVDDKLRQALGIDVQGVFGPRTMFGFPGSDWKPFTLFDGTQVLVPGAFNTTATPEGDLLIYPEGDTSVPASARMPRGGFYFDSVRRQQPIDEDALDPGDNLQEFGPLSQGDLDHYASRARELAAGGSGLILSLPGTAFGDIALVPGPWLKDPRGIRDVEEWYISTVIRKDYVYKVFELQCEIALDNLRRLAAAVGDLVQAAFVTGTDFGTQRAPFISAQAYRDLYKPFHRQVNDFIHRNTTWKTFMHSCGCIYPLLPEFIDAGFDIMNPVQCSAAQMEPRRLKDQFGDRVTFWGGGVDTQRTLPFGTPQEVYDQVRERIAIFNVGGGFVFNTIHNIQANTPVENMLAMFKAISDAARG